MTRSIPAGSARTRAAGSVAGARRAGQLTPQGLVFDPSGNLYILDWANSNVRKVDANGIITTVVGDTNNWVVRKISTSRIISTVAGNGQ